MIVKNGELNGVYRYLNQEEINLLWTMYPRKRTCRYIDNKGVIGFVRHPWILNYSECIIYSDLIRNPKWKIKGVEKEITLELLKSVPNNLTDVFDSLKSRDKFFIEDWNFKILLNNNFEVEVKLKSGTTIDLLFLNSELVGAFYTYDKKYSFLDNNIWTSIGHDTVLTFNLKTKKHRERYTR